MRRAIALVHIQVNHRHLKLTATGPRGFCLQQTRRHRHVVEHTKTAAFASVRMVGAAGQISGHAYFHGRARSADGGADRAARPLDHAL